MTKLVPRPGAKPGELQVMPDPEEKKPDRGTRWKIARTINEAVSRHLDRYTLDEILETFRQADPRGYMQFMQEYVRRDKDDETAGVQIIVQQYISTPTPTKGVGGSPIAGDIEVLT